MKELVLMKAAPARILFVEILSALFVLLFMYTAIMKLTDVTVFTVNMEQSALLRPYAWFLAWAVPLAELAASVLLILPRTRYKGLWAATILIALFTGYIGVMLIGSYGLPCSCGGIIREMTWNQHFVFNMSFFFAGVAAIILYNKNIAITRSRRIPEI